MILDMPTATYTLVHIIISLIGIGSGFLVMFGLLTARRFDGATALFLVTTVLTSVTGFGFPFDHLLPSHLIGIISLIVLAIAILARYVFHMAGAWRARSSADSGTISRRPTGRRIPSSATRTEAG